jgi:hypothetical protein
MHVINLINSNAHQKLKKMPKLLFNKNKRKENTTGKFDLKDLLNPSQYNTNENNLHPQKNICQPRDTANVYSQ